MRYFCILLLFVLFELGLLGQNFTDVELWSNVAVSKKITDDVDVEVIGDWRYNNYVSSFKQVYLAIEPTYRLNKFLKIGGQYRYVFRASDATNGQRLTGFMGIKERIKPINLSGRLQYQYDRSNYESLENGRHTLRIKAGIEYQRKKKHDLVPFVSAELFYVLGNTNPLSKYRLQTGLAYDINKRNKVQLRYVFQQEVNSAAPLQSHIIGLSYSKKLRKKKKKKKKEEK
mgnify:CR=1 FL=1